MQTTKATQDAVGWPDGRHLLVAFLISAFNKENIKPDGFTGGLY